MTWERLLYFPNTSLKGGHRWSCVLDSSVWSSVLLDWNWEFGHQLLLLSMVRGYLHLYYLCGRFTGTVVKNSPAHAGDTRQAVSVPGSGRSPEKEIATHSSILACKVPWTGKPGVLQSMGLQRVRKDWVTKKQTTNNKSFPNSAFSDVILVPWNSPWWEYLHYRIQQMLQVRALCNILLTV